MTQVTHTDTDTQAGTGAGTLTRSEALASVGAYELGRMVERAAEDGEARRHATRLAAAHAALVWAQAPARTRAGRAQALALVGTLRRSLTPRTCPWGVRGPEAARFAAGMRAERAFAQGWARDVDWLAEAEADRVAGLARMSARMPHGTDGHGHATANGLRLDGAAHWSTQSETADGRQHGMVRVIKPTEADGAASREYAAQAFEARLDMPPRWQGRPRAGVPIALLALLARATGEGGTTGYRTRGGRVMLSGSAEAAKKRAQRAAAAEARAAEAPASVEARMAAVSALERVRA